MTEFQLSQTTEIITLNDGSEPMAKVLLVEDNELNRTILARRLKKRGFEIVIAEDGKISLQMAKEELPDIILMDLSLPVMDGWEATKNLKANPLTCDIPVIALTAHAMSGDREKAISAGCDDYDTKPVELPRLISKINSLLERSTGKTEEREERTEFELGSLETSLQAPAVTTFQLLPSVSAKDHVEGYSHSDHQILTAETESSKLCVLVVDDIQTNRDLLVRRLEKQGHKVVTAVNGREALQILENRDIDLVLLDIMMPEVDGYQVLKEMKSDTTLRHVPVIVVSASQETESVVRCIEMGADDYLPKPCDAVLLRARVSASLGKKRLHDQEIVYRKQVEEERKRAEDRLRALFPHPVVQEMKAKDSFQPRRYEDVAVLFTDIVGFTPYCEEHPAEEVVAHLQRLVQAFEQCCEKFRLEKIKTVGDAFMATAGLMTEVQNPVLSSVQCGLDMIAAAKELPPHWDVRVGVHYGTVVAGIVGSRQYSFDLWGDTVNLASRVESHGYPGSVNLSSHAWQLISHQCRGESRMIEVKGKGTLEIIRFKSFL